MKRAAWGAAAAVVSVLAAGPAWACEAAEKSWSFEAGADWASLFLFRGVDLLDGESVLMPWVLWSWRGFAVSYYGSYGDLPGDSRYGENDFALDYTFDLGEQTSLTLGGQTYRYNGGAERDLGFLDTYEIYGILELDVPLSPTLTYYHDVDKVDGGYGTLGLGHRIDLGSRTGLELKGTVGFDFHYNNKDVSNGTLNDVLLSADLPVEVTDHFSIHAGVQRSIALEALDEIVRADPEVESVYGDQTVITAGVTLSF